MSIEINKYKSYEIIIFSYYNPIVNMRFFKEGSTV